MSSTSQPELNASKTPSHLAPTSSQLAHSLSPAPALSLAVAIQTDSVEDLVTQSRKVFASPEMPRTTVPIESWLTPAQEQRVKISSQEAIQHRNERLRRNEFELNCMKKKS